MPILKPLLFKKRQTHDHHSSIENLYFLQLGALIDLVDYQQIIECISPVYKFFQRTNWTPFTFFENHLDKMHKINLQQSLHS